MALDDIDESKYNLKFLFYALKSRGLKDAISGSAQPQITRNSLSKVKLSIPKSLADQKRIAKVLSDCEALIQKRKDSIALLDELLKSTFLEMFGDPVRNEKGWEVINMDQVVNEIISGTSYTGSEKEKLEDDEFGVLKISAVTSGELNENEFKAVSKSIINKKLITLKRGMLLMSRANFCQTNYGV